MCIACCDQLVAKVEVTGIQKSCIAHCPPFPFPCSATDCGRRIFLEEGFPALFRGVAPRLPRVVFGQSITLAGYDAIVGILNKMW